MLVTIPVPLQPGDRIRVIAPSSPFDRTLVLRGIGWLGERYRVEFDWGLFERAGFLAGSDARRLAELNGAIRDPGIRAIVAARGGYGLTRITHLADMATLRLAPKWIVGFSDVTALHLEALRLGVASLHADNVAGLGRGCTRTRNRFIRALETPGERRTFEGLDVWHSGEAAGPLVAGNLTLMFAQAAARRFELPDGAILAIEDVTEASYRVDRMLSALLVSGALDRVAGVVVGDFVDCAEGPHGVPVVTVLRERLGELGVPVLAGLRFGHGLHNLPLVVGSRARIDGLQGRLTLNPEAPTANP